MPELPEVESVRKQLSQFLTGHKIVSVDINYEKFFSGNEKWVLGSRIKKIRRFGKALSIDLANNYSLVIHIKMTGQLIYRGPNLKKTPNLSSKVIGGLDGKHTHVVFHLDRSGTLYYNDVRKFGWIKVVKTKDLKTKNSFIKNLGPEILVDSKNPPDDELTLAEFKKMLGSSRRSVKTLLMDQKKIAGVGNIYANDALWLAKIHPAKPAYKISAKNVEILFDSVKKVLADGLKRGGASENNFVTPDGSEGKYQKHFRVYGREGELCTRCKKAKIKKVKLSGRGTFYCPNCQKI